MTLRITGRTNMAAALVSTSALATAGAAEDRQTTQIATHSNQGQMAPLLTCHDQYRAECPLP